MELEFADRQHIQPEVSLRKAYEIIYPDRSRKRVTRDAKEQMLLAGDLRPTSDPAKFVFVGEVLRVRSFSDMGILLSKLQDDSVKRRYLGLRLTVELKGRRHTENQMTPEGLALKLRPVAAV